MSYTVAQNTSFLTFASVLQKVISFVYFTIIARVIGVENTGQYFFAISFTTIFAVVADFGLVPVLTREASKFPDQSEGYVNTILWTKIVFGCAAYGLLIVAVNLLNYDPALRELIYLSGVTMFFDSLQGTFFSIFRAHKNLVYESIGVVASQFITLVIGTIAIVNHASLLWLIAAYTIPSFGNTLYGAYFGARAYGLHYRFTFNFVICKAFVALAVPFALAGIIGRLYAYTDSILMSKLLPPEHLGWWSVPYKITFAFQFIPSAVAASVYPVMSSLSLTDPAKIGELFTKAWRYLFAIIFPLSFGLGAVAKPVIVALYGERFLPSVPVLRLLLVSLIFSYLGYITGALLNATNHQKVQTSLLAVALGINTALNLLLLPRFGIEGAALTALMSNSILCISGFYFARRFASININAISVAFFKTVLPAAIMAVVVWLLTLKLHFVITIPLGVALYGGLLFWNGTIDRALLASVIAKIWYKKNYPANL
ncbi:MAG: flippase [Candidatus Magasanikbacteria bacterium]|nr:flippase [Candidatus Magasanikbacteria bacterium]